MGKGTRKPHRLLRPLTPLVKGLAQMLGPGSEVVLHDLRHLDSSIVAIEGDLTGRTVGGPITDLVLRMLEDAKREGRDVDDAINYRNRTLKGRVLKSSTIFIRDEEGTPVGCLCINLDVTDLMYLTEILETMCRCDADDLAREYGETFHTDVNELVAKIIQDTINTDKPAALLTREEKLDLVLQLDSKGVFAVKGAVALVARHLGVSRYTIYNYMAEARESGKGVISGKPVRQVRTPNGRRS